MAFVVLKTSPSEIIHTFIPFYFAAPLGKDLIKRTSQRIVATIGGCLMGGGFVLAAFAESIGVVYLAFFISGKFSITIYPQVLLYRSYAAK